MCAKNKLSSSKIVDVRIFSHLLPLIQWSILFSLLRALLSVSICHKPLRCYEIAWRDVCSQSKRTWWDIHLTDDFAWVGQGSPKYSKSVTEPVALLCFHYEYATYLCLNSR